MSNIYRSGFRVVAMRFIGDESSRALKWGETLIIADEAVYTGDLVELKTLGQGVCYLRKVEGDAAAAAARGWFFGIRGSWTTSRPVELYSHSDDGSIIVVPFGATVADKDGRIFAFHHDHIETVEPNEAWLWRVIHHNRDAE